MTERVLSWNSRRLEIFDRKTLVNIWEEGYDINFCSLDRVVLFQERKEIFTDRYKFRKYLETRIHRRLIFYYIKGFFYDKNRQKLLKDKDFGKFIDNCILMFDYERRFLLHKQNPENYFGDEYFKENIQKIKNELHI